MVDWSGEGVRRERRLCIARRGRERIEDIVLRSFGLRDRNNNIRVGLSCSKARNHTALADVDKEVEGGVSMSNSREVSFDSSFTSFAPSSSTAILMPACSVRK